MSAFLPCQEATLWKYRQATQKLGQIFPENIGMELIESVKLVSAVKKGPPFGGLFVFGRKEDRHARIQTKRRAFPPSPVPSITPSLCSKSHSRIHQGLSP
jgi:hypothetical protein